MALTRPRNPHRGRSGFTLIEVLIVLSVMGIMAALSVPLAGTWLQRYRTNASTQEMAMLVQRARVFAASRSQKSRLVFFPNEEPRRAAIESWETVGGVKTWTVFQSDVRTSISLPMKTDFVGMADDFKIYFLPNGLISSDGVNPMGGETVITVQDGEGHTAKVKVWPSGKVLFEKARAS